MSKTRCNFLSNLQQCQFESVELFYHRIIKAVNDLQYLAPSDALPVPNNSLSFNVSLAFAALPETDKKDLNVEQEVGEAFGHLALQLFISNLQPSLSNEILELKPKSLSEAFQKAKEVEHFKAEENSLAMLKKVRTH